jgi:hypothetical protein
MANPERQLRVDKIGDAVAIMATGSLRLPDSYQQRA